MKKRNIITALIICFALIGSALMFTLLLSGREETSETIHSEKGNYSIFRTQDAQEYLSFLENFDETKFEIVDISTSMRVDLTGSFYVVTYKTISQ